MLEFWLQYTKTHKYILHFSVPRNKFFKNFTITHLSRMQTQIFLMRFALFKLLCVSC